MGLPHVLADCPKVTSGAEADFALTLPQHIVALNGGGGDGHVSGRQLRELEPMMTCPVNLFPAHFHWSPVRRTGQSISFDCFRGPFAVCLNSVLVVSGYLLAITCAEGRSRLRVTDLAPPGLPGVDCGVVCVDVWVQ